MHPIPMPRSTNSRLDEIIAKMGSDEVVNPEIARRRVVDNFMQLLTHAMHCRSPRCFRDFCWKMKLAIQFVVECRRLNVSCPLRRYISVIGCYHASHCINSYCRMSFCDKLKETLRQSQAEAANNNHVNMAP